MPIISAGPSERSFSTVGSSPPNSTCTPACSAGVAVSNSSSNVARPRSAVEPSNCTAANAVEPSGEIERGPASGSVTASTCSSDATSAIVASIAAAVAGSLTVPSSTWNTTIAVAPARSGKRCSSRSTAACDSTPGTRKSSTASPPATRFNPTRPSTATTQATRTSRWWAAIQRPNRYNPFDTTHLLRRAYMQSLHFCNHCSF